MRHDAGAAQVEVPWGMRIAAAWTWRLGVVAAGVVALAWLLSIFKVLVVPVLVAVLLSALLSPLVELLDRTRLPRGVAVLVAMVLAIGVVAGLVTLVGTQLASGFTDLEAQSAQGVAQIQTWLADGPLNLSTNQINGYVAQAREQIRGSSDQLVSGALAFTATAGHVVTGIFLTFFSMIFFLLDGRGIWAWVTRLLPRAARERADLAGRRGWVTLTHYVRATIIVASTDAIGIGVGAALLGVPLAVPLGVLVFLGAFVPVVGAAVSGGVAVLVALVALGPIEALVMLGIVVAVQQLESHVLQPLVLGRAVSVHPLAVILAIGAGLLLAGIVGALFAVPLVAVLNTVVLSLNGTPQRDAEMVDDDPVSPGGGLDTSERRTA